jgi:hypothetical protein
VTKTLEIARLDTAERQITAMNNSLHLAIDSLRRETNLGIGIHTEHNSWITKVYRNITNQTADTCLDISISISNQARRIHP